MKKERGEKNMAAQPKEYFDIETAAKKDSYAISKDSLAPEVLAKKFKRFSGVEKVFYLSMVVVALMLAEVAFSLRGDDLHLVESGLHDRFHGIADVDHLAHLREFARDLEHALDTHARREGDLVIDHLLLELLVLHIEIDHDAALVVDSFPAVAGIGQNGRDDLDLRMLVFHRRQLVRAEDIVVELVALDLEHARPAAVVLVQFAHRHLAHFQAALHILEEVGLELAETGRAAQQRYQPWRDAVRFELQVTAELGQLALHLLLVRLRTLCHILPADRERRALHDLHHHVDHHRDAACILAGDRPHLAKAAGHVGRFAVDHQPDVQQIGHSTDHVQHFFLTTVADDRIDVVRLFVECILELQFV